MLDGHNICQGVMPDERSHCQSWLNRDPVGLIVQCIWLNLILIFSYWRFFYPTLAKSGENLTLLSLSGFFGPGNTGGKRKLTDSYSKSLNNSLADGLQNYSHCEAKELADTTLV